MKKNNLLVGILLAVVGLLMLIIPNKCIQMVVILLGIEAVANGIYNLLYTRKLLPDSSFQYSIISRGMMSIIIGLLAFFLPLLVAETMWKIMLYVLAVYLLIGAGIQVYAAGKLRNTDIDRKQFVIEIVVSIIVAVILIVFAAENLQFVVRICGAVLFIISGLYTYFFWKNRPVIAPVEVVDEVSGTIGEE